MTHKLFDKINHNVLNKYKYFDFDPKLCQILIFYWKEWQQSVIIDSEYSSLKKNVQSDVP